MSYISRIVIVSSDTRKIGDDYKNAKREIEEIFEPGELRVDADAVARKMNELANLADAQIAEHFERIFRPKVSAPLKDAPVEPAKKNDDKPLAPLPESVMCKACEKENCEHLIYRSTGRNGLPDYYKCKKHGYLDPSGTPKAREPVARKREPTEG